MGQLLDLLGQSTGKEPLDRLYDAGMERAPAVPQERPIRDLVGQGVLEGVLELGEEIGLVQELRGLELHEVLSKLLVGHAGDGLEQPERHVGADDGRRLKHTLLSR